MGSHMVLGMAASVCSPGHTVDLDAVCVAQRVSRVPVEEARPACRRGASGAGLVAALSGRVAYSRAGSKRCS